MKNASEGHDGILYFFMVGIFARDVLLQSIGRYKSVSRYVVFSMHLSGICGGKIVSKIVSKQRGKLKGMNIDTDNAILIAPASILPR